jgi:hypothetical protein
MRLHRLINGFATKRACDPADNSADRTRDGAADNGANCLQNQRRHQKSLEGLN